MQRRSFLGWLAAIPFTFNDTSLKQSDADSKNFVFEYSNACFTMSGQDGSTFNGRGNLLYKIETNKHVIRKSVTLTGDISLTLEHPNPSLMPVPIKNLHDSVKLLCEKAKQGTIFSIGAVTLGIDGIGINKTQYDTQKITNITYLSNGDVVRIKFENFETMTMFAIFNRR